MIRKMVTPFFGSFFDLVLDLPLPVYLFSLYSIISSTLQCKMEQSLSMVSVLTALLCLRLVRVEWLIPSRPNLYWEIPCFSNCAHNLA